MKKRIVIPDGVGAYCGVLQQRILVSTCPLPKGQCMWQDRVTKLCRYTQDELTPVEFAQRVSLPPPSSGDVELRKTKIIHAVRDEQDCK